MNQFEEADRYAIDLYGAVQDAYLQTARHEVKSFTRNSGKLTRLQSADKRAAEQSPAARFFV